MRARAAHERESPGLAAEQLDRLHRHDAQGEVASLERERASVGYDGLDGQSRSALAQRAQ